MHLDVLTSHPGTYASPLERNTSNWGQLANFILASAVAPEIFTGTKSADQSQQQNSIRLKIMQYCRESGPILTPYNKDF